MVGKTAKQSQAGSKRLALPRNPITDVDMEDAQPSARIPLSPSRNATASPKALDKQTKTTKAPPGGAAARPKAKVLDGSVEAQSGSSSRAVDAPLDAALAPPLTRHPRAAQRPPVVEKEVDKAFSNAVKLQHAQAVKKNKKKVPNAGTEPIPASAPMPERLAQMRPLDLPESGNGVMTDLPDINLDAAGMDLMMGLEGLEGLDLSATVADRNTCCSQRASRSMRARSNTLMKESRATRGVMPLGSLVVIQQHAQDLLDIVDKQLARIEAEALRRKAEEDNAIKTAAAAAVAGLEQRRKMPKLHLFGITVDSVIRADAEREALQDTPLPAEHVWGGEESAPLPAHILGADGRVVETLQPQYEQVFVKDPRLCASVWSHLPASAKHALLAAGPKMATTSLRNMITHWSTMQPPHGPHATQAAILKEFKQATLRYPNLSHVDWRLPLHAPFSDALLAWAEHKAAQAVPGMQLALDITLPSRTPTTLETLSETFGGLLSALGLPDPAATGFVPAPTGALSRFNARLPRLTQLTLHASDMWFVQPAYMAPCASGWFSQQLMVLAPHLHSLAFTDEACRTLLQDELDDWAVKGQKQRVEDECSQGHTLEGVLAACTQLHSLTISRMPYRSRACGRLFASIPLSVQRLSLEHYQLSDAGPDLVAVTGALRALGGRGLRQLSLSLTVPKNTQTLTPVIEVLNALSDAEGLTHLSFKFDNYCLPSSEDQYLGSQALARMLSRMGALESLRLHCPFSNNEGGETLMERWGALQAGPLMHVLDKQRKLRVLELLGAWHPAALCSLLMPPPGAQGAAPYLPALCELVLHVPSSCKPKSLWLEGAAPLAKLKLSQLTRLCCSMPDKVQCNLPPVGILRQLTSMQVLRLPCTEAAIGEWQAFAAALPAMRSLRVLSLSGSEELGDELGAMVGAAALSLPSLEECHMDGCDLGNPTLHAMADALLKRADAVMDAHDGHAPRMGSAESMQPPIPLRVLVLSGNPLVKNPCRLVEVLMHAQHVMSGFQLLDLRTTGTAIAISRVIKDAWLAWARLGRAGARILMGTVDMGVPDSGCMVANNDGLYSLNAKGRPVKYGVRTGRKVLPEPQSKVQLPGYW